MRYLLLFYSTVAVVIFFWVIFKQASSTFEGNENVVYWTPKNTPNPKKYPIECNPTIEYSHTQAEKQATSDITNNKIDTSNVWTCNPELVVQQTTVDNINSILTRVHTSAHNIEGCRGGPEVGVLIVNRLDPSYQDISVFAREIHDLWGVGDPQCNNGVIFLVAIEDRKWYISTGAGIKNILTSDAIDYIGSEIKPLLQDADYDVAVEAAVAIIADTLTKGKFEREASVFDDAFPLFSIVLFGSIAAYFIACAVVYVVKRVWWYGKQIFERRRVRESRERRLSELERRARENRYVPVTLCSICLEDFNENENAEILYCGHKFHTACIDGWLERNNTCPVCRRRAPRESEEPDSSVNARPAAGVDDAFLFFARSQLITHYSYWNVPVYPTATTTSFWNGNFGRPTTNSNGGGAFGSASGGWGGGSSFGGGGGGGSW